MAPHLHHTRLILALILLPAHRLQLLFQVSSFRLNLHHSINKFVRVHKIYCTCSNNKGTCNRNNNRSRRITSSTKSSKRTHLHHHSPSIFSPSLDTLLLHAPLPHHMSTIALHT